MCGNLYFVGTKDSATHLLDTGEGLLLFDTGYPNMQDFLPESITKLGFDPKEIRYIFHTHGHFDHFGATRRLKEISGASTCISGIDACLLRAKPEMALCHYMPDISMEIPEEVLHPDRELEDGEILTIGKTRVHCILTPGHTPGAMSYEISVQENDQEYTALLCAGVGFNTLNIDFIKETGLNWREDFERSLTIWKGMKPDIFLGNHTPQSKTLERKAEGKSFVDREAWPSYIAEIDHNFHEMIRVEG